MGWGRRKYGNPDKNQPDILAYARNRLGILHDSAVVTTGVGGGFPDNVLGFHGLTILVEVKGPDGKLRPSQVQFIDRWDGGPVLVVDSADDLFVQLISLDRRVPPVRGLPADWRKAVTDAVAATDLANKLAAAGTMGHPAADQPDLAEPAAGAAVAATGDPVATARPGP